MIFEEIELDGARYPYVVYVPRDYTPQRLWPLVVFLHGSGESGTDGQKHAIQGLGGNILWNADRWPCIVLMPQKPDRTVLWPAHEGLVLALLERVRSHYAIDPDRIALTGLSQGGHGTIWFGARHPGIWSAIAPVCGFVDSNRAKDDADALAAGLAGLPVWAFHGDADDVVPIAQTAKLIDAMKRAGASPPPKFTIYPGVNHGSWDRAYAEAELPAFLLRRRDASERR